MSAEGRCSKEEYLKRYLSGSECEGSKKKRKKSKKHGKSTTGMKIVEDDAFIIVAPETSGIASGDDEEDEEEELKPELDVLKENADSTPGFRKGTFVSLNETGDDGFLKRERHDSGSSSSEGERFQFDVMNGQRSKKSFEGKEEVVRDTLLLKNTKIPRDDLRGLSGERSASGFSLSERRGDTSQDLSPPRRKNGVKKSSLSPRRAGSSTRNLVPPKKSEYSRDSLPTVDNKTSLKHSSLPRKDKYSMDFSPPRRREKSPKDTSPPRRATCTEFSSQREQIIGRNSSPSRRRENSSRHSLPPRSEKYITDSSPPRKRGKSPRDPSPPRRRKYMGDSSPASQRMGERDSSPPEKRGKSPRRFSTPRKESYVEEPSFQKRRQKSCKVSPPSRRGKYGRDSPPQRKREKSSRDSLSSRRERYGKNSCSPRRRGYGGEHSSPRRKEKSPEVPPEDSSALRRVKCTKGSSPLRMKGMSLKGSSSSRSDENARNHVEPMKSERLLQKSPPSRKVTESSRDPSKERDDNSNEKSPSMREKDALQDESSSPGRSGSVAKVTLDGKIAGLQTAASLRDEMKKMKEMENKMFEEMEEIVSGRNAEPVRRAKMTGKNRETKEDIAKKEREAAKQKELDEKYVKWNKGVYQNDERSKKLDEMARVANEEFARLADNEAMNIHMKEMLLPDDPMLSFITKKKHRKALQTTLVYPKYKGVGPPNRFGIQPGYRWDGVDRSNGFEARIATVENKKSAQQEAYYRSIASLD